MKRRNSAVLLLAFITVMTLFCMAPARAAPVDMDTALDDVVHRQRVNDYFRNFYVSALEKIAEQLTTLIMEQVVVVGTFMDAQYQIETQRLMQDMDTQISKAYMPDTQVCIFGTNVRSLAMSDQKAEANSLILNNAMLTRPLLSRNNIAGEGRADDLRARMEQYNRLYCDPNDNFGMLGPLCTPRARPPARRNRDLDYTALIDSPLTLDIDFTNNALSADEEDILALSHNLFGAEVFKYIPDDLLIQGPEQNVGPASWLFQNIRSLQAIRGVAQNSFAHLVGMKAQTNAQAGTFMTEIVRELGMPDPDIARFIGQNPSYFAQMDFLTKRLYQSPDFFVNLFTTPNNVERLGVTLQAIRLMSDRDRFEASLRREMLMSLIVEMKLRALEKDVDDSMLGSVTNMYIQ